MISPGHFPGFLSKQKVIQQLDFIRFYPHHDRMSEESTSQPEKRFSRLRGIVDRVWGPKKEHVTMDPYMRFQSRLDALPPGDLKDQHQQLLNTLRELYPDPNDPMASYNIGMIEGGLRTLLSLPGQLDADWARQKALIDNMMGEDGAALKEIPGERDRSWGPQKDLIDQLIARGSNDIDDLRRGLERTKYPDAREPSIDDAPIHMKPMPPTPPGQIIQPPDSGSN